MSVTLKGFVAILLGFSVLIGCEMPEINPEGVVALGCYQGLRRADRYESDWREPGEREISVPKPRVWLIRWEGWELSAGGRIRRWSWAEAENEEAPEQARRGVKFRARMRWRGIEPTRVYIGIEVRW